MIALQGLLQYFDNNKNLMNEKTENINYIILADWVRHTWFELQSKGNYDSNKKAKTNYKFCDRL